MIALAIFLGVMLVLSAGMVIGGWRERRNRPEPQDPLAVDLGRAGRYVALGDSYSAGEGLDPWEEGTEDVDDDGDRCHRSRDFAYAVKLRFVHPTTTQFRACSGAKVENVYDNVQEHGGRSSHQGLQVKPGIPGDDVALVTLTMGGNDLDFASVLGFCAATPRCEDADYKDGLTLREWVEVNLKLVKDELVALYGSLRADFENARILVLGYPALFPEKAPPITRIESSACNLFFTRWTGSERDAIREWGGAMNKTIQGATVDASALLDAGKEIEFVDVHSHFTGHEPCTTGGEWVRFLGLSTASAIRDGSFHPLARGQTMMARIVACHLDVFPTSDTERTRITGYAMAGCIAQETALVADPG